MTWRQYLLNNMVAWDHALNTLVKGRPGETLSARAATARRDNRWWGRCLCNWFLDRLEKDHCADAMKHDSERASIVIKDNYL